MAIKYFCDSCGVEVTSENRMKEGGFLVVGGHEIEFVIGDDFNDHNALCQGCVFDALYKLDERPAKG